MAVDSSTPSQHINSLLILGVLRRSCVNELAWALLLVDA